MKFDEETLLEIEICIEALDQSVGLSADTIMDIHKAIIKQRSKLKILNKITNEKRNKRTQEVQRQKANSSTIHRNLKGKQRRRDG